MTKAIKKTIKTTVADALHYDGKDVIKIHVELPFANDNIDKLEKYYLEHTEVPEKFMFLENVETVEKQYTMSIEDFIKNAVVEKEN